MLLMVYFALFPILLNELLLYPWTKRLVQAVKVE